MYNENETVIFILFYYWLLFVGVLCVSGLIVWIAQGCTLRGLGGDKTD